VVDAEDRSRSSGVDGAKAVRQPFDGVEKLPGVGARCTRTGGAFCAATMGEGDFEDCVEAGDRDAGVDRRKAGLDELVQAVKGVAGLKGGVPVILQAERYPDPGAISQSTRDPLGFQRQTVVQRTGRLSVSTREKGFEGEHR
jgi:hypothetical protein